MTWPAKFKLSTALALAAAVWAQTGHALSETSLRADAQTILAPFFATGQAGELRGAGGVAIAYRIFRHPAPARATVLVLGGYSESLSKYAELAYDLFQDGHSVILYDHRGQGLSGHLLADPQRAHLDDFENLVRDLHTVRGLETGPVLVVAHSMGAAVAARYLEEYPHDIEAAVLSAPMLALPFKTWQRIILLPLIRLLHTLGLDQFYVRGPKDPAAVPFAESVATHSEVRRDVLQMEFIRRNPQAQVWGVTGGWLAETLHGLSEISAHGGDVRTPVLMLLAEDDRFVDNRPAHEFCARLAHCRERLFSGSRHEILMEVDAIRDPALAAVREFLKR